MLEKFKNVYDRVKKSDVIEKLTSPRALAIARMVVASLAIMQAVRTFRNSRKDDGRDDEE